MADEGCRNEGRTWASWMAAAAAALVAPAAAMAAHPLITDDAGTVGRGAVEVEVGSALSRDEVREGGARMREDAGEAGIAVGVGVLDRLDVAAGVAGGWSRTSATGARTEEAQGLGDVVVELKWQVLEANGFALALKPGVTLPTGDAAKGLGTGRPCYALTAIASQALGKVGLHANVAYLRDEYGQAEDREARRANRWHVSAAVTGEVASGLQLVADVGAETSADRASRTWPAYALGGVICSPRERLEIDLGVKMGLTDPEPDLSGLLGVTLHF